MVDNMKRYDRKFLNDLLAPIIRQWGRDEVLHAISEIHETDTIKNTYNTSFLEERKRSSQKPSAVMIAEKYNLPSEKRILLIEIAAQFDHKSFLPTISDVRNFLKMRGEDAGSIKQRPEAFRKVIKAIVDMPDESLQRLIRGSRHSGPSQLGPLSDAIKAASASVREQNADMRRSAENSGSNRYHPQKKSSEDGTAPSADVAKPSGRAEEDTRKGSKEHATPSGKER